MKDSIISRSVEKDRAKQRVKAERQNRLKGSFNAKSTTAEAITNKIQPTKSIVIKDLINQITETSMAGEYICHMNLPPRFSSDIIAWVKKNRYIAIEINVGDFGYLVICWYGVEYLKLYCGKVPAAKDFLESSDIISKIKNYIDSNISDFDEKKHKVWIRSPKTVQSSSINSKDVKKAINESVLLIK